MHVCEVKGCKCQGQRHHIIFRSQGGLDIDLNYKYLCAEHHNMGNCSPHMSREVDIGYKIELQSKVHNRRDCRIIRLPEENIRKTLQGCAEPCRNV